LATDDEKLTNCAFVTPHPITLTLEALADTLAGMLMLMVTGSGAALQPLTSPAGSELLLFTQKPTEAAGPPAVIVTDSAAESIVVSIVFTTWSAKARPAIEIVSKVVVSAATLDHHRFRGVTNG
jgi:hypothetical protein